MLNLKKLGLWGLFILLAVVNGLYPLAYFFVERFALLQQKPDWLLASRGWQIGFYVHIVLGGIALLVGWTQFVTRLRDKNISVHRAIGKIYVVSAVLASLSGIGIGFFAAGGFVSSAGFISLGTLWFFTTVAAFVSIKKGRVDQHEKLMIYSYALCFAAATLRIYIPLSQAAGIDFISAYRVIAWISWVPNLLIASLLVRRIEARPQLRLAPQAGR